MAKSQKTKIEVSDQNTENQSESFAKKTPDPENIQYEVDKNAYKTPKSIALLAIIAGIIVIVGGYAFYKIANRQGIVTTEEPIATVDSTEQTGDVSDSEGIIQADQQNQDVSGIQPAVQEGLVISSATPESTWIAYNHTAGDIQGKTYTAVNGDTLWEIAEGAYGNGTMWHQIATANNVGYLPNGNPLVLPGQVLTIP